MKAQKTIHVFIGILTNAKGEILMSKRSESILPEADNCWELPGGKADFGETAEQAIEREFREETGYEVEAVKLLPTTFMNVWNYKDFLQHTLVFCYECRLKSNKTKEVSDHKVSEVKWINPQEISKLRLLAGVDRFINNYINEKNAQAS